MSLNEDLQRQLINDMLIESYEGLDRFDQYLLDLEQGTADAETLNAIFRVIHTIKGTSGCLALGKIERVAHVGESLLQLMREGRLNANRERVSALLAMSDRLREMLATLENEGNEGTSDDSDLIAKLDRLTQTDYTGQGTKWGLFDDDAPAEAAAAQAAAAPAEAPCPIRPMPAEPVATAAEPAPPAAAATHPPVLQLVQRDTAPAAATPAAEAPVAAAPAASRGSAVSESAVRVDVGLLDQLMNLVGELVLARNQILQHTGSGSDDGLVAASQRLNNITSELQENVMKTRMQPIGNVWSKFPRVVRDLSSELGKQVSLVMDGNETELDRTIIEAIKDPLTHIVRNSVDHGIEKPDARGAAGKSAHGTLVMRAFHEGGKVIIEIIDDGRGIDVERVVKKAVENGLLTPERAARISDREAHQLIFAPGFSTAAAVTNVSGRGVGMDVVKTNIDKIGGSVDVSSERGRGTTIRIKIPLTLAIIPALMVTSGGDRFAIPQVSLLELVRLGGEQARNGIEMIHGAPVFRLRGTLLPLVHLNRELELGEATADAGVLNIVILQADGQPFGLIVDAVNDTEEIVVKPLDKRLKGLTLYAGATIRGDGQVALILDVLGLAQRANVVAEHRDAGIAESHDAIELAGADKQTLLVLGIGERGRVALPLGSVARLEEFALADVEYAGGEPVVQYRDQLLPLVPLTRFVPGCDPDAPLQDPVNVVVHHRDDGNYGFVVDRIEDIVQTVIEVRRDDARPGLLGSIVVQQRVTDLLDADAIVRLSGAAHSEPEPALRAA